MGLFSKKHQKVSIAFDIGSSSVGGAVFLLSENEKPRIVFSERTELPFQQEVRYKHLVTSMLDAFSSISESVFHAASAFAGERTVTCFLASPWYASQTRISKKIFTTPVKVSKKLLEEMYSREAETFRDTEMKKMEENVEVFEIENVQTKLNGYETAEPYGKEAAEVQAALYVSVIPEKISREIKERVKKHLHGEKFELRAFPFASFVVVRDLFHEKNFLLLDISGEVTDVSIVRDNLLQETASFPCGKNYFLRSLANKLQASPEEAMSIFQAMKEGAFQDEAKKNTLEAFRAVGKDWRMEFQKALGIITPLMDFLPHDVFVASDEDVSSWFIENIQDEDSSQFTLADDSFTVRHLNAKFFSPFCDVEEKIARDPFLMAEGLFLSRFQ